MTVGTAGQLRRASLHLQRYPGPPDSILARYWYSYRAYPSSQFRPRPGFARTVLTITTGYSTQLVPPLTSSHPTLCRRQSPRLSYFRARRKPWRSNPACKSPDRTGDATLSIALSRTTALGAQNHGDARVHGRAWWRAGLSSAVSADEPSSKSRATSTASHSVDWARCNNLSFEQLPICVHASLVRDPRAYRTLGQWQPRRTHRIEVKMG
jgi:hypothetical protein